METTYDFNFQRRSLVPSESLIHRRGPAVSAAVSTLADAPYVTQLISKSEAALLSYSDDGFFRFHDKSTLRTLNAVKWEKGGDCTCMISSAQGYMASGRNGCVGYWDARNDEEVASLAGPSKAPYLSLAGSGNMVATGTELQGVDASIDVWDLRQTSKPVVSFVEAHSDDVTSLSFHPTVPFALLSASSDSLVAVSDICKTDEDDSVLGVINTGASVARAGWGGSSTFRPKAILEGEEEELVDQNDIPNLGAFWSVSDMQTLGIWEADGWEELVSTCDVRQGETDPMKLPWKTEFVVDAGADSQLLQSRDSVGLFCGNQNGTTALIQIPNQASQDWIMHCLLTGGHSEIVRSVLWDVNNSCVFTGAEDGRICGWQLAGDGNSVEETPIKLETPPSLSSFHQKSPGAFKERQRPMYKPY